MDAIKPEEIRNLAVVGHKGAGKTSLIEAMLYLAKATPKLGEPGHRMSGLDESAEERDHLATLETRALSLRWNGAKINILDTPGEASFYSDTRMALAATDAVLMVVSAKDGVQTGTERLFRWARESALPCLVVVTKVDDEKARSVEDVIAELRSKLEAPFAMMTVPIGAGPALKGVVAVRTRKAWVEQPEGPAAINAGEIPPEAREVVDNSRAKLVDDVASTDDALTERYLNDGDLSQQDLDAGTSRAVAGGALVPLYVASSLRPSGVAALLNAIVEVLPPPTSRAAWKGTTSPPTGATAATSAPGASPETPAATAGQVERRPLPDAPVAAFVFKTHIDPHAGRLSFVRVLSGVLRPDSQLLNTAHGGGRERAGHLLQGSGKEMKPVPEAVAGDIVALPKLKATRTGDTLSDEKHPFFLPRPELPAPLFARTLLMEEKGVEEKVAVALQRLGEEDPGLVFSRDELSRDLLISGLGALHLEITAERIRRRTGIECRLGPPKIAYRETVTRKVTNVEGKQKKQSGGHGQFGVCYIDLEPLQRGSGFEFEDAIVGGVVPRQFIPSVEKGVVKALQRGILAGYPVVDLRVRLIDGKTHSVDSSDAAFQVAGYRAFRAAAAAAHPALLEPVVKLLVTVPGDMMGDVIGDLNSRHGKVVNTDTAGSNTVITALVPLAQTLDYEPKLTGMTQGRGTFTMGFDHYEICSPIAQEKIIKESGFKTVEEED